MRSRSATKLLLIVALFTVTLATRPAAAQEPQPDDPATTLYRAVLELESAGEYDLADSLMDLILRRYPDSAAASSIRLARSGPDSRRLDSSGRTELVVWSTLYGLWLGLAVPGTLGVDDPEPYGLGLLVGGPLGFLASRSWTASAPVGEGDAEVISWGGTWGSWQGFGWAHVLDLGGRDCEDYIGAPCDPGPSSEAVFGSMLVTGAIGTATGLALSRRYEIDPGDATSASLGSLWGTWYGFGLTVLFDMSGDDALAATLVGGDLGLLFGAALGSHYDLSRSRARIASIAGVAGGLAGAGLDLLIQPDDEKVAIAIPLISSTLGLALGMGLDRRRDREPGEPEPGGGAGRLDWRIGGPVLPTFVEGEGGERKPAVAVTLFSGRF